MAYKLTHSRFHALANGFIIGNTILVAYEAWLGNADAQLIIKFILDTTPSWLTFLTAVVAAMVVFIAIIYTVQDSLFWELFSGPINLEHKTYKAVFLLGVACFFLICSSQQPPTYQGWQGVLAMLGLMIGIQGLIKASAVFVHFYNMNYGERRKAIMRKQLDPATKLRARFRERREANRRFFRK
jgi:hypothetical protein